MEVRFSPVDLRLNSHLFSRCQVYLRFCTSNFQQISPSMKLVILVCVLAALALHVNAENTGCVDESNLNKQDHPSYEHTVFFGLHDMYRVVFDCFENVDLQSYLKKVKTSSLNACKRKCAASDWCVSLSYDSATQTCYMSQRGHSDHPQRFCPKYGFTTCRGCC